jgi:hypothetical protein
VIAEGGWGERGLDPNKTTAKKLSASSNIFSLHFSLLEPQSTLSRVHSLMRVKLAQAGDGGGCTPTPFHDIYHHHAVKLQCTL